MSDPLAPVAARRDRVLAELSRELSAAVDAPAVSRATELVLRILPKKTTYSAVYRSLLPLVGTTPDRSVLRQVAWAFAANYKVLKLDCTVWPPVIPKNPEAVTAQILACRKAPPRRDQGKSDGFRIRYRFRITMGFGAPTTVEAVWSSKYVSYLASHPDGFGFSRPPRGDALPKGRPYQHYESIVGFLIKFDLSTNDEGRITIERPRCTPGLRDYNKALIEMRWRSKFVCPFNFTHPCHQCPKGKTSCQAATHPLDHVNQLCPSCMNTAEFDLYWKSKVCRKCDALGKRVGRS